MATVNQDSDITIYIEGDGISYTIRYEVLAALTVENLNSVAERMRKSFNLDRRLPDAFTEPAILRKAELMKSIFRREYGLSSIVVDLITR